MVEMESPGLKLEKDIKMSFLRSVFLAMRPKTLSASLVPCLAVIFLTKGLGLEFEWSYFWLALFSSFCIQIGTNFVNDAKDFKKGADTEKRLGPQRVTQSGLMTYRQVMTVAGFFFLLAILLGIPLVLRGGWEIVIIGLVSVLMGYAYTGGPFPLAYKGLGDLFVILFFGVIAVSGLGYLFTLQWSGDYLFLGLQVGFHGTVLIAINNLRDHQGDALVNKKTLAVRFGEKFVRYEITVLLIAPYFMNYYWAYHNVQFKLVWAWCLLSLPLAVLIAKKIWNTPPSPIYNKYLGLSALHQLLFTLFLGLGML